jgi:hypothetical protein
MNKGRMYFNFNAIKKVMKEVAFHIFSFYNPLYHCVSTRNDKKEGMKMKMLRIPDKNILKFCVCGILGVHHFHVTVIIFKSLFFISPHFHAKLPHLSQRHTHTHMLAGKHKREKLFLRKFAGLCERQEEERKNWK